MGLTKKRARDEDEDEEDAPETPPQAQTPSVYSARHLFLVSSASVLLGMALVSFLTGNWLLGALICAWLGWSLSFMLWIFAPIAGNYAKDRFIQWLVSNDGNDRRAKIVAMDTIVSSLGWLAENRPQTLNTLMDKFFDRLMQRLSGAKGRKVREMKEGVTEVLEPEILEEGLVDEAIDAAFGKKNKWTALLKLGMRVRKGKSESSGGGLFG